MRGPPITVRAFPTEGVAGYWRFEVEGYPPSGPTKTPLLSAARQLLEAGVAPDTVIQMVNPDPTYEWAMRSTVGKAAGLTVQEGQRDAPSFRPWRPFVKTEEKP